ncbi:MAG: LysR substrate-binding domain-containing protein, partial [Comamonas sp.]
MNLSARDIQAFLALAEVKNFTRAAVRCHLSQPAFSALIKALEASVGLQLFDRSTRHVLLTPEGERFWLSAQRIAAELEDCAKAMRDTAQLARGHVSVALLPSLAAGWLPQVLAQFMARHPGVDLAVHDVLSEPCIAAVANGEADFALAAIRADTPELQAEPFCRDDFHLVCREDHALAAQQTLGVADLLPWPFVHLARHSSVRQYLDAAFFPQSMHT